MVLGIAHGQSAQYLNMHKTRKTMQRLLIHMPCTDLTFTAENIIVQFLQYFAAGNQLQFSTAVQETGLDTWLSAPDAECTRMFQIV